MSDSSGKQPDFPCFDPIYVGSEGWDKFTKRELIAVRILEKIVEKAPDSLPCRVMAQCAVDLADELLLALYPKKN